MAVSALDRIKKSINENDSFILDAGAGSGKTWSLVESLKHVITSREKELYSKNQKIVCITYTNIAKNEIIERLENNKYVFVSTIHDFLWSCISPFKKELKEALLEIIDSKISIVDDAFAKAKNKTTKTYIGNLEKKAKLENDRELLENTPKLTQYKNYVSYKNNIISHDEVIVISKIIFFKYPVIKKLIADSYPIIFIDEYQDTFPDVIDILLEDLNSTEKILFGFYGDKMQKIYDRGIGEIPSRYELTTISKEENFRCSRSVVELLNKIRDDIQQVPSGANKEINGSCTFYQSLTEELDVNDFVETTLKSKFALECTDKLKILYLTHRLISRENGYENLYIHVRDFGREDALTQKDEERCPFINFLYQIEMISNMYEKKNIQSVLSQISFEINSFEEKAQLKKLLDDLLEIRQTKSIQEVITYIVEKKILQKNEKMSDFDLADESNKQYYEGLMEMNYSLIIKAYNVANQKTPYSTKHGTKGAEYENVLVVIDDTAWKLYNFDKYFSDDTSNESIYNRTRNLFYVSCSRAEHNLAVLTLSSISDNSKEKINEFFGEIISVG